MLPGQLKGKTTVINTSGSPEAASENPSIDL